MQRLLYSIIISFFLIISCGKKRPEGVVSEKKMSEILTEVSLIDGYLNSLPTDSARKVMPVLYGKVFERFKLDSALFIRNVDYYFGNPELTEKIYKKVQENLSQYERVARVEDSVRTAFVQDSINRINYMQRLYSNLQNLRYYYKGDDKIQNYIDYSKQFFLNFGLDYFVSQMNINPIRIINYQLPDSLKGRFSKELYPLLSVDTVKNDSTVVVPKVNLRNIQKLGESFYESFVPNIIKRYLQLGYTASNTPTVQLTAPSVPQTPQGGTPEAEAQEVLQPAEEQVPTKPVSRKIGGKGLQRVQQQ